MILIKTLFLNLIPEEVTVVEPEALVGLVTEVSSSRDVFQSNSALPAVNLHFIELTVHDYMLPKHLKCQLPVPQQQSRESAFHHQDLRP